MSDDPTPAAGAKGADADTRPAGERRPGLVEPLLVALALIVLATRLAAAFADLRHLPLNPDVGGFITGARTMDWFYDSGGREPLFCAVLAVGLLFSGDGELVARVASSLMTLLAATALWAYGRKVFGAPLALGALGLFAINPVVAFYGPSGLRAPLYTAMLLLLAWLLPARREARLGTLVAAGVVAASIVLLRQHAIPVVAAVLLLDLACARPWRAERLRPALRRTAIVAAVAGALVLPEAFVEHEEVGRAGNFWLEVERHGTPGDWREGEVVGSVDFLLANRSPGEAALLLARNALAFPFEALPGWLRGYELAWLLLPVGIGVAVLTRRAHAAAMVFLALGPSVAILHLDQVPGVEGVERRFVYQCFPFALLLILLGAAWILERAVAAAAARRPRSRALHRAGRVLNRWVHPQRSDG